MRGHHDVDNDTWATMLNRFPRFVRGYWLFGVETLLYYILFKFREHPRKMQRRHHDDR